MLRGPLGLVVALSFALSGCLGASEGKQMPIRVVALSGDDPYPESILDDPRATDHVGPFSFLYQAPPADGTIREAGFRVPGGATELKVVLYLNSTHVGAYWVDPFVCACNPTFTLTPPPTTNDAGWRHEFAEVPFFDAGVALAPGVVQGPFEHVIQDPKAGTWTVSSWGSGENVQADVTAEISFV
jgi:hypothetical protein